MTDAELVIELKNGSTKALELIYHMYVRRVYAYCFPYIKSRQITEEVVQDVFLNLWRYHERIDPERELSTLIYTVAKRYRINAMRNVINEPTYEDYVVYQNDLHHEDASMLEYDDLRQRILTLASKLPKTQRKVFMLSRFNNKDVKEISRELNLSEKTVHNQLSLALKKLRQGLEVLTVVISGANILMHSFFS